MVGTSRRKDVRLCQLEGQDSPVLVTPVPADKGRSYVSRVVSERIDFYCAEPAHQVAETEERLTMYDDRWAYCPGGVDEGHRWQSTGGMSLSTLRRRLAEVQHSA